MLTLIGNCKTENGLSFVPFRKDQIVSIDISENMKDEDRCSFLDLIRKDYPQVIVSEAFYNHWENRIGYKRIEAATV